MSGDQKKGPDLRLAGFAIAIWLSSLASLYLSSRAGLLLGATGIAAAGVVAFGPWWPGPGGTGADGPDGEPAHVSGVPGPADPGSGTFGPADPGSGAVGPAGRGSRSLRRAGRGSAGLRLVAGGVRWVGVAVLLGVGCGGLATGVRMGVVEAAPLRAVVASGERVRVDLVVRDDPRALSASPGLPPTYLVGVDLLGVWPEEGPGLRMSVRALVLGSDPGWRGLLPGQRVRATGKLLPPRKGDLRVAAVSVRDAPELVGRPPWVQRAAGVLRAGLQRACEPLPDDAGGLLPGLVVGDTSRLDPALSDDFRTTGMTHVMIS